MSPSEAPTASTSGILAPTLGAILFTAAGVALTWAAIDARPRSSTAILYVIIGLALTLPFVAGLVQHRRNPGSDGARSTLRIASRLLMAFMVIATLGRCAANVSAVGATSDLARGGGSFFIGAITFIASRWSLLFVPGIPLLFMLRSLAKATTGQAASTSPSSRSNTAAAAAPLAASALLLLAIPLWPAVTRAPWSQPDAWVRDTALAKLKLAHGCLHDLASESPPAYGYPMRVDSSGSCFAPLIGRRDHVPQPWLTSYEPIGAVSGNGAAHYRLRLTQRSPGTESLQVDDAGELRLTAGGDTAGTLLNERTGCRAMRPLVEALASHRAAHPEAGFPVYFASGDTSLPRFLPDTAGLRDTLILRDTLLMRASYDSDVEGMELYLGYDEGRLVYQPRRREGSERFDRFTLEWRPTGYLRRYAPGQVPSYDRSLELRGYHADERFVVRAASARGAVGGRLSAAPECR